MVIDTRAPTTPALGTPATPRTGARTDVPPATMPLDRVSSTRVGRSTVTSEPTGTHPTTSTVRSVVVVV